MVLGNLPMLRDGLWLNAELFGGRFSNAAELNTYLVQNSAQAIPMHTQSPEGEAFLVLWRRGLYNTHTSSDVYIFLPLNIDQLAAAFDSFLQSPNACTAFSSWMRTAHW